MKQILSCLHQYKKDFIATPVLVILETICELFLVVNIGNFIDELTGNASMTMFARFQDFAYCHKESDYANLCSCHGVFH